MSPVNISPLGAIYREEAVRRLARPGSTVLPWVGNVAKALEFWLERTKQELVSDRAGFLTFPKSWMGSYPDLASTELLFGKAHVDPFRMDMFDFLVILASNDADLAHDDNKRGPGKRWSHETRRLLSQIRSCSRVNSADIVTMLKIAKAHLWQMSGHVAKIRGSDRDGVYAILLQRVKQRGFVMPNRLKHALDDSFDFRRLNYIWSTSDTIRVHAPGRARQKPFEPYHNQLKEAAAFPGFYTHSNGLIDPYGSRMINGNKEPYQALRFPSDPVVAQSLIAISAEQKEALGVLTVIDVTTQHLAEHTPGRPLLLGSEDPGLMPSDGHDHDDDPGFKR